MNPGVMWLWLLCLIPWASIGQQNKIDSLENLLLLSDTKIAASLYNQLSELSRKDTAKAMAYARQALQHSEQLQNVDEKILALKNIAIAHGYNNRYDKALIYLQNSSELAQANKNWGMAADNALNIGTIHYVVLSNYEKALQYYLQSLGWYEKVNDQKGVASALSGLGIAYTHEKKFKLALETLDKSLSMYEKLGQKREVPKILVNIGTAYKEMEQYGKAIEYLEKAIAGFDATANKRGRAHAQYVIGDAYRALRQYDQALANLTEALALNTESNHKNSMAECLIQMGMTYMDMKDLNTAETHFIRAASLAHEIGKPETVSTAYRHLSDIHRERRDFEKAINYLAMHKSLFDSIYNEKKSQQIAEMQIRFDTETKARQIELLNQEKELNKIYLFVAIALLVSVSVIAFLIITRQKYKIKTERTLAEKESQLMSERRTLFEAELRNRELTELSLQSQLEFKNKELATYTLNLIQKNEILEDLKSYVEEIKNTPDTQIRLKLNGLINKVNYSFHLDRDWENFKIHFEQVHRNFFRNLIEKHPDLNANDLKLCSLIKLNMDNREIASVLNISQESIKVARHRLRKKLELSAEQNLIAFLATHD